MTRGRERRSQERVRGVGVWVQFRGHAVAGRGGLEGEREGGGKVVGWERVETMVAGRFCGEMFACSDTLREGVT